MKSVNIYEFMIMIYELVTHYSGAQKIEKRNLYTIEINLQCELNVINKKNLKW